jgi:hypothetical protein
MERRKKMETSKRIYDITGIDTSDLDYEVYQLNDFGDETPIEGEDGYDISYYYGKDGKWLGPDDDGVCLVYVNRNI